MNHTIFIRHCNFRIGIGGEQRFDLARILVEHEDLAEMGARGAKQIEAVSFRLGQGLFVAENDAGRIILDAAQSDKAAAFQFIR